MKLRFPKNLIDGSWSVLATLSDRAAFFVAFVLLARSSPLQTNGAIVSAFAFCMMLSLLFDFGFPAYLQREAAARPQSIEYEAGVVLFIKAVQVLPFAAIAVFYGAGDDLPPIDLAVIVLATFCFSIATALTGILWGLAAYRKAALVVGVSRLVLLTSAPLHLITTNPGLNTLSPVLASSLLQLLLVRLYSPVRFRLVVPTRQFLRSMARSSLPIGVGLFFVSVYDRVDVLLIRYYLGLSFVSYYAAAYALYRIPSVIDSFLLVPSFSSLSAEYAQSGSLAIQRWKQLGTAMLSLSVVGTIGYYLLADWLCTLVYGSKFETSASALKILGFALPGLLLNRFVGVTLNAVRRELFPTAATFAGIVSNIAANVLLLSTIGFVGAAWATIVAEYTVLLLGAALLARTRVLR